MSFFFFHKLNNRSLSKEVSTSGGVEGVGKWCRRVNMCKYYVHMFVNVKMIPAKTIPGMGEGEG
jgi:hypothetical protein